MPFPHLPQQEQPSKPPPGGGILIVDNYDSFTYNIRNHLGKLGADSRIIRNDSITESDLRRIDPGAIIIGPGPGSPHNPEDIGITPQAIEFAVHNDRALLGICLGHQALATHFGGEVIKAHKAVHGKTSKLELVQSYPLPVDPNILDGIDPDGSVMRYHSLCVDRSTFPQQFSITSVARDDLKLIMSIQHRQHPLYGVQFHPESFATDDGLRILENFLRLSPTAVQSASKKSFSFPEKSKKISLPFGLIQRLAIAEQKPFELREFPCDLPPEHVYTLLHAASDHMVFFESLPPDGSPARSYFGCDPMFVLRARDHQLALDGEQVKLDGVTPFDVLAETSRLLQRDASGDVPEGQHFSGGLAGFLSYEAMQYLEPKQFHGRNTSGNSTFCYGYFDDGLVYDSGTKRYSYFSRGRDRFGYFQQLLKMRLVVVPMPQITQPDEFGSPEGFMHSVKKIQNEEILTGNSFQTVLSRRKSCSITGSMSPLYLRMRLICPSAHMHAIKMGSEETMGSLPELAMHIIDGNITSLPLAGTAQYTGHEPTDAAIFERLRHDPKELAEHSMLVDLARNDVARIAELGSVEVPKELLMHRKDAGSVMHIASEVRGKLRSDILPIRALLEVTPMGTGSGAPKIRSMKIIKKHELLPRGLYASSPGFVDVRGNVKATMGLRSLMRYRKELTIQAGAGIVMDSDPKKELQETEQKMLIPLKTIEPFFCER
ncbi:hypothetical protein EXS70_04400 [Candidatus Peribacteria bacterium]|nr:hypothetical protein [Candidatus Peribacteria bacterium]